MRLTLAVLAALLAVARGSSFIPLAGGRNFVSDWGEAIIYLARPDSVFGASYGGAQSPLTSQYHARLTTFAFVSQFETYQLLRNANNTAVTALTSGLSGLPKPILTKSLYTGGPALDLTSADPDIAASAAAHFVLSTWFWNFKERNIPDGANPYKWPGFDGILIAHIQSKSLAINSATAQASIRVGKAVARAILVGHVTDGIQLPKVFSNPTAPAAGAYRFVTGQSVWIYPQLASATPWIINVATDYPVPAPPYNNLTVPSAAYLADLAEVQSLGAQNSGTRTADQTAIAFYWRLGRGTPGVPGVWTQLATYLARTKNYNTYQFAHLFAKLHSATLDSQITGWAAKAQYLRWRPESAIRDTTAAGGNDPNWWSLLAVPPHPEYPSTHSSACGAAAEVLKSIFGSDNFVDIIGSNYVYSSEDGNTIYPSTVTQAQKDAGLTNLTIGTSDGSAGNFGSRSFASFSAFADECSVSRVYAGVHFRSATTAGQALGRKVGAFVAKSYPGNLTNRILQGQNYYTALSGSPAQLVVSVVSMLVLCLSAAFF